MLLSPDALQPSGAIASSANSTTTPSFLGVPLKTADLDALMTDLATAASKESNPVALAQTICSMLATAQTKHN
jgi:hypothetical protein